MSGSTLTIKDLHVSVEGKEILKGVNLEIKGGNSCDHGAERNRKINSFLRDHGTSKI